MISIFCSRRRGYGSELSYHCNVKFSTRMSRPLCSISVLILSGPANHQALGLGGIPAHTLRDTLPDTPRDTLGPSDLTFWETVRKQGQRQGAKSDLRYWRTVQRRRALRPSFHYTHSTVSRLAWTGHLWCNMTLWAPKGFLACVSFVRRLIFETSVSPQSPDAMSNTRCSGGLLLHN